MQKSFAVPLVYTNSIFICFVGSNGGGEEVAAGSINKTEPSRRKGETKRIQHSKSKIFLLLKFQSISE